MPTRNVRYPDRRGSAAFALVSCIPNSLQFVATKMPQGEARGGSILGQVCDRRATKPWGILVATRRAAVLFGSRFVAHSSQTAAGMLVARRLAGAENPSPQTVSCFGYTTLALHFRNTRVTRVHGALIDNLSAKMESRGYYGDSGSKAVGWPGSGVCSNVG